MNQACQFKTARLIVEPLSNNLCNIENDITLSKNIITILSDDVTQSLPGGWQGIDTSKQATTWLKERKSESLVLTIQYTTKQRVVGFLLLNDESSTDINNIELRFGYLFAKGGLGARSRY